MPSASEKAAHAAHIWSLVKPIQGTPGERYLRGHIAPQLEIKSPELAYLDDWRNGEGAIAASVRDRNGVLKGVHVLPLSIGEARLTVGSPHGFMALSELAPAMVIGVGIEETIIAGIMTALPAIAVVAPAELARLRPPKILERLVIAYGHDREGSGPLAASTLGARLWSERVVVTYMPPPPGKRCLVEALEVARTSA
jgi:hypothetical protein